MSIGKGPELQHLHPSVSAPDVLQLMLQLVLQLEADMMLCVALHGIASILKLAHFFRDPLQISTPAAGRALCQHSSDERRCVHHTCLFW